MRRRLARITAPISLAPVPALAVVLALALAACKGDARKCEAACRNYATLRYWKVAEADITAAPPGERDAVRNRWRGRFPSELENGVELCVSQCQSANNAKDIDCMIAAKTADRAEACLK